MSHDEFKSLKNLGKKMSKPPSDTMMQAWAKTPFKSPLMKRPASASHWAQLAAALLAGIIIGKFVWQSSSDIFSAKVAKNHIEDETFEYVYTNN